SEMIALSGQGLAPTEVNAQLEADFARYNATAPLQGRSDRIANALVSLGVYTRGQATAFAIQMREADSELAVSQFSSNDEAQNAVISKVLDFATSASGAQFSKRDACGFELIPAIGFALGLMDLFFHPPVHGDASGFRTAATITGVSAAALFGFWVAGCDN